MHITPRQIAVTVTYEFNSKPFYYKLPIFAAATKNRIAVIEKQTNHMNY